MRSNVITREINAGLINWSLPKLLETPSPLAGEPLAERNAVLRKAAEMAAESAGDLSETVRLQVDFWGEFQAEKISEHTYLYPSYAGSTKRWELTINALGLFYKDLSGEYDSQPGGFRNNCSVIFGFMDHSNLPGFRDALEKTIRTIQPHP